MFWWQNRSNRRDIEGALSHLNQARDEPSASLTRSCELYFHGLNKLWNAHARSEGEPNRADTTAFVKLLQDLPPKRAELLLQRDELRGLIELTPAILDHSVLKARGYMPGVTIGPEIQREASERHRKLKRAWSNSQGGGPQAVNASLLKKLSELLFVVRSNIAHGEKTPYSPDREKARRDEDVCRTVLPVLILLVELLLDQPSQKLVTYGTLRLGESNASLLESVPGAWLDCLMKGQLLEEGGLRFFTSNPGGAAIPAKLLISEALPEAWPRLDSFEGSQYQRHLVTVEANQAVYVANVYETRSSRRVG